MQSTDFIFIFLFLQPASPALNKSMDLFGNTCCEAFVFSLSASTFSSHVFTSADVFHYFHLNLTVLPVGELDVLFILTLKVSLYHVNSC